MDYYIYIYLCVCVCVCVCACVCVCVCVYVIIYMNFVAEYCDFEAKWYEGMSVSDESRFCQNRDAPERSLRRLGGNLILECLKTTVKHGTFLSPVFSELI